MVDKIFVANLLVIQGGTNGFLLLANGAPVTVFGWAFRETGGSSPVTIQLLSGSPTANQDGTVVRGLGYANAVYNQSPALEIAGEHVLASARSLPAYFDHGIFCRFGCGVLVTGTGAVAGSVFYK